VSGREPTLKKYFEIGDGPSFSSQEKIVLTRKHNHIDSKWFIWSYNS